MRSVREWTDADREVFEAEKKYLIERQMRWFDDEDKAKVRRSAKKQIANRIDEILVPQGFEASSNAWEVSSRGVKRSVAIQPSRGGDRCFINVGRVPASWASLLGQRRQVKRLQHFCESCGIGELGELYYFDVEERPEILDKAADVLRANVVPWLLK